MTAAAAVLVTGALGMLGTALVAALASARAAAQAGGGGAMRTIVATDLRLPAAAQRQPGVDYAVHDVRAAGLEALLRAHAVDTVVHLASIVTPGPNDDRDMAYAVDVGGTRRVLDACLAAGVRRLVVSSSGAAYGYHADNPAWLTEELPLRGNDDFAYARHKRLVEEMLAQARQQHPALEQVVLRIGTILADGLDNQITALFQRPRPLAIRGSASPFVFVWIDDVVGAIVHALDGAPAGVYNLAGDGALTMPEIAQRLGTRCRTVPAWLLSAALALARPLRLTRHGPEQVGFLRWRPVLDNTRLKREFGFVPRHGSAQAFDRWAASRCASR